MIYVALGVCVVYTITFADLVRATPLALGPADDPGVWREILLAGLVVLPLCCSPHLKFLASSSAVGLGALIFGFCSIAWYGAGEEAECGFIAEAADAASTASASVHAASSRSGLSPGFSLVAPASWGSFANWFGVAAFCFGVPPLQFSLQDAMAAPRAFTRYLAVAMLIVWATYTVVGVGTAWLYRCDPRGIGQNILLNLPEGSPLASSVRLCYAVVCLTSYPLCLVPVSSMVAAVAAPVAATTYAGGAGAAAPAPRSGGGNGSGGGGSGSGGSGGGGPRFVCLPTDEEANGGTSGGTAGSGAGEGGGGEGGTPSVALRVALVLGCTGAALAFPHFGLIVSIIGSFAVTMLSFVLPSAMALAAFEDARGSTGKGRDGGRGGAKSSVELPSLQRAPLEGSRAGGGWPAAQTAASPAATSGAATSSSSSSSSSSSGGGGGGSGGSSGGRDGGRDTFKSREAPWWRWADAALLVLGLATCAATTSLTIASALASAQAAGSLS